ncbi:recombination protein RecR [Candidatus Marinamargulisbacteria bacterium SCGC AAA071-K20]|nr:recombination protein RecR [Candidatus Marinamargulisbacteria bacterium SCGC AAA071-K20]
MPEKNPLNGIITQLKKLPGVGEKSAQRLALFLLSLPKKDVHEFVNEIGYVRDNIKHCEKCYNFTFSNECFICTDITRSQESLCIVAEPKDILALERTCEYKGLYHILGGLVSPIDGVYIETLRINELLSRVKEYPLKEIILAINPTIEGEATILYLTSLLKPFNIPVSKLAYGLPVGSDIDYADDMTLQKALSGRQEVI